MKSITLTTLLITCSVFSQEYKELKITDDNGVKIINNAHIDRNTNSLIYINNQGFKATVDLNKFQKIEYRKGSYWLTGTVSGLAVGFAASMIVRGPQQEVWHGLGPFLLFGGLVGTGVGALFPRYKVLDTKNNNITLSFNSIKYSF